MSNISKLIEERTGYANLLNDLDEKLSASELNSLLLELFRKKAKTLSPPELLTQFEKNRFTQPLGIPAIGFKEFELQCMKLAEEYNFNVVTLSPLTCFATCSAMAFVDQNNVVTAVRGTEVVSDATNVFALLIAQHFKKKKTTAPVKYATVHRHVRSQAFNVPGFTAHFGILCMATGGPDTGSFAFELDNLTDHINLHVSLLSKEFGSDKLFMKLFLKDDNEAFRRKLELTVKALSNPIKTTIERQVNAGDYYQLVQFKIYLEHNGKEINLSDGGFTDWTQKLIQNKKHRLLISGAGTELIYKIKNTYI
jgi:hypothetical protein